MVSASLNYPQWTITNTIVFDFDDCYQTLLNQLPAMGVDMVIDDDNNLQVNVKEVV